jgi:hypothetical protein
MGGRIKKRRTRLDIFSEKAAELLSQLQDTHIAAVLQSDQSASRTVEHYADSGLRTIDINKDHPAFPPVGFALPIFEIVETPSAWRSPTFVPDGGRIYKKKETMEDGN